MRGSQCVRPDIMQARMMRLLQVIRQLHVKRMSINDVMAFLDLKQRTAYRYLALLEEIGLPIERGFDKKFFIAQDNCPLCGRNQQHTTNGDDGNQGHAFLHAGLQEV